MTDAKLLNGDLVLLPSGMESHVSGIDEVVQRLKILSRFYKGDFAYDRELGLLPEYPTARDNLESTFRSYAAEALMDSDAEIRVDRVSETENGISFGFTVSDGQNEISEEVIFYGQLL